MAGEDQYCLHKPDHQPIRGLASGLRHSDTRGSEVGEGLSDSGERLSSVERLHHRPHIQQPIRMGEKRARSKWVRTQDSRQELSACIAERGARSGTAAIPDSGAGCSEGRRGG